MKPERSAYESILIVASVLFLGVLVVGSFFTPTRYETAINKTVAITVPSKVTQYVLTITKEGGLGLDKKEVVVGIRGAGAFITKNGHIITAAHLFTAGQVLSIQVTNAQGVHATAQLLYLDTAKDLAILTTPFVETAHFKLARNASIGERVFAVGSPLGLPFSVSEGIISALHRDSMIQDATQTDTPINPGNSGGPLVNTSGQLVGICSHIRPPVSAPVNTGLGFATSIASMKDVLNIFKGLGE